jgi:protein subunit release factor B
MPPRPTLPDSELHHVYLKGSGPGGQKINKTNSACQLTHIPTGIVVKSQATRSRSQNHNIARRILAEKIELLEKGDQSRAAIKTAVASKRKASKRKKALRKYRKLEEAQDTAEDDDSKDGDIEHESTGMVDIEDGNLSDMRSSVVTPRQNSATMAAASAAERLS